MRTRTKLAIARKFFKTQLGMVSLAIIYGVPESEIEDAIRWGMDNTKLVVPKLKWKRSAKGCL